LIIGTDKSEGVITNKVFVFSLHENLTIVLDSCKFLNIRLHVVVTRLELKSVVDFDLRDIHTRFWVLQKLGEVVNKSSVGDDLLLIFKRLSFHAKHDYREFSCNLNFV
jgi:hypothetical protein